MFYRAVAEVYKSNHDHSYNESLSADGIKHVYIEKFETFENRDYLNKFLMDHGRTLL
jgi:hypothetical protein